MAGLYFHIPFCSQRCVYCDFYFVTTSRDHGAFVEALLVEVDAYGREFGAREPAETIYFGGGTPSLLPLRDVARILAAVEERFDATAVSEITFEVNPENATPEYLAGLRALGVNRLSLGVQSFFPDDLKLMGRAHDAEQAEAAVRHIARAGFASYSVDLIFGVPGQPPEHWAANLERCMAMEVPHLSTYGLTVEEKTPLHKMVARGMVVPAGDDEMNERYLFTMDYLESRGYEHYEVSSFARPGHRSGHNQLYWRHANYIGFGPSAHSFWRRGGSAAVRWANVRNLKRYQALLGGHELPLDWREHLRPDALADEYIMIRLRLLTEGLDLDELEQRYGVDLLTEKVDELAELEGAGLIRPIRNGRVRLSKTGVLVADSVTARLITGT